MRRYRKFFSLGDEEELKKEAEDLKRKGAQPSSSAPRAAAPAATETAADSVMAASDAQPAAEAAPYVAQAHFGYRIFWCNTTQRGPLTDICGKLTVCTCSGVRTCISWSLRCVPCSYSLLRRAAEDSCKSAHPPLWRSFSHGNYLCSAHIS